MSKIILYINNSPDETVDKILTNSRVYQGDIYEWNLETPKVELPYESGIDTFTYLYIEDFKRYYYIIDRNIVDGFIIFNCIEDYLMSWKNEIKNQSAIISKQETDPIELDFNDGTFQIMDKQRVIKQDFITPLATSLPVYFLTVI